MSIKLTKLTPSFPIRIIFAVSVFGNSVEPMIVYPFKIIRAQVFHNVLRSGSRTENGWMAAQTFYEWIGNALAPYMAKNDVQL